MPTAPAPPLPARGRAQSATQHGADAAADADVLTAVDVAVDAAVDVEDAADVDGEAARQRQPPCAPAEQPAAFS